MKKFTPEKEKNDKSKTKHNKTKTHPKKQYKPKTFLCFITVL